MHQRLADGLKGVTVDVGHIVLKGVPCRAEGALLTIRIVRNDIDTGNLCHTIHGHMVVCDATTLFHGEETAEANSLSSTPNTVYHITGILE